MPKEATVVIIHHEPERYLATLQKNFSSVAFYSARSDSEVYEQVERYAPDVLLSFRCDPVSSAAQIWAVNRPFVKWVQVAGAGYDHIGPLESLACQVTNSAGVLSRFQAETVMGAMINLIFGLHLYHKQQEKRVYRKLPWRSLEGQRLLLIGLGHVGRAVAVKARQFGMHITVVRSQKKDSSFADMVSIPEDLPTLLPQSDVVSLHIPYSAQTHHFFDREKFAAMKESALFINTARGGVVDEQALIATLEKKRIRGAYIDVFSEEPLPEASPLWQLDSLIITPHYCDAVEDWHERFAGFFADNLKLWQAGKRLKNLLKC